MSNRPFNREEWRGLPPLPKRHPNYTMDYTDRELTDAESERFIELGGFEKYREYRPDNMKSFSGVLPPNVINQNILFLEYRHLYLIATQAKMHQEYYRLTQEEGLKYKALLNLYHLPQDEGPDILTEQAREFGFLDSISQFAQLDQIVW